MHMVEQYCFLGWLHHILGPFILPTLKQQGTVEVHCSCSLFKSWSASAEAVPHNNGKQNRSLGLSAGTCSMQHCINAIAIILEWREKQNVQLKPCLVQFLREFTTRERCQTEGSGKHNPLFNRSAGKEQEQPCKPPPWLPPQLHSHMPLALCRQPCFTGWEKIWVFTPLHCLFSLLTPPSHPALYIYDGALWLLQTELEGSNFCMSGAWAGLESKRLLPTRAFLSLHRTARVARGAGTGQRQPAAAPPELPAPGMARMREAVPGVGAVRGQGRWG